MLATDGAIFGPRLSGRRTESNGDYALGGVRHAPPSAQFLGVAIPHQDEPVLPAGPAELRGMGAADDTSADSGEHPWSRLRGRRAERRALDRLLTEVRSGGSAVLVLRGEVGIGKTALLEYILDRASGCTTILTTGIKSETELSYARLHQLCEPMAARMAGLPGPQRDALATAFGLQGGPPPDHFLVGLAVLGLFADTAREQPLVCLVDDVQWLDRASLQPLAFVARRARTDGFALVFAVRESAHLDLLAGLPELLVHGLDHDDARALLATRIIGPVDEQVCDRILTEARGNPRSLLDLPRGLTAADLAAGFAEDPAPSTSRMEQGFVRRLYALPPTSRRALVAAAAEPIGEADLFWRALQRLGIDRSALGPAVGAGLIEVGARIRFGHPLLR